jgi:Ca2+-binding EF-hand superfamily protein
MTRLLCAAGLLGALVLADVTGAADDDKKDKGKGQGLRDPEAVFKKLDTNKDGKLSKEEFMKLAELRAKSGGDKDKAKEFLEQLFTKLDTNNDGFLSLEEFKKISELRPKKPKDN